MQPCQITSARLIERNLSLKVNCKDLMNTRYSMNFSFSKNGKRVDKKVGETIQPWGAS